MHFYRRKTRYYRRSKTAIFECFLHENFNIWGFLSYFHFYFVSLLSKIQTQNTKTTNEKTDTIFWNRNSFCFLCSPHYNIHYKAISTVKSTRRSYCSRTAGPSTCRRYCPWRCKDWKLYDIYARSLCLVTYLLSFQGL